MIKALERKIVEANLQIEKEKMDYENELGKNPPEKAHKLLLEYTQAKRTIETRENELERLGWGINNYDKICLHIRSNNPEMEKVEALEQKKLQELEDLKGELRLEISFADSTENAMKFVEEIEKRISAVLLKK